MTDTHANPSSPTVSIALWLGFGGLIPFVGGAALLVHGVMLLLCLVIDRRVYPAHGLQAWLPLRGWLSLVAATACLLTAAGS